MVHQKVDVEEFLELFDSPWHVAKQCAVSVVCWKPSESLGPVCNIVLPLHGTVEWCAWKLVLQLCIWLLPILGFAMGSGNAPR
jgi:hypothetical protein